MLNEIAQETATALRAVADRMAEQAEIWETIASVVVEGDNSTSFESILTELSKRDARYGAAYRELVIVLAKRERR